MERVNNKWLSISIGFSCGNQFVMTPSRAFKVRLFSSIFLSKFFDLFPDSIENSAKL